MRTLLFILFLSPIMGFSQTSYVFIRMTDSKGVQINGDATARGFERTIRAFTTSSSGKNNTQFNVTMPVTGAAAVLKNAMANDEMLMNATVYMLTPNSVTGNLQPYCIVAMEKIRVLGCAESMGCNNQMTTGVTLQAIRIGWTYYTADKAGNMVVSQKYGFDADTGGTWTKF